MASFFLPHSLPHVPVRVWPFRWRYFRSLPYIFLLSVAGVGISGCGVHSASSPDLTIASVKDLGTLSTNPGILGRDGGYSAAFQGYSVWLYGDTFLAKSNAEDFTLISDSWSYTRNFNAQNDITGFQQPLDSAGAPTMILPETPMEEAFNGAHNSNNCQKQPCGARWALWPSSIAVDPVSGHALVFYMLVYSLPGNFNFQAVGNSVATWQSLEDQPQRPTINPPVVAGHPDLLFNEHEPSFGSAALICRGTLYIYGCGIPTSGSDKGCRLGKVNPANVLDRSTWSYYAGNGHWSSQAGHAVSVFAGDNILSVAWNSYLQRYLAVYSAPLSQNVMMRTAPNPEGPWSDELIAFTAMQPAQGNVYDAHAHSEFDANGGQTIYVTYSLSTPAPFSSEMRLVSIELAAASVPTE
ncbi:DUF4185 domain-containing protein [Alloacidobacterium dinghuense]|uniref:DUF4185 domain-containing protein n=1 Tax=Alloacidobacterium dinghuense TaxID=2763107 RepID=A0A7G8BDM8_9BACT|nr:DUF4185 domain-containing protein [Alloacidobacterium dinghuense]QNI30648.1 DUF4185 domain-containing protein [Alloacidobacterium dinghuense]